MKDTILPLIIIIGLLSIIYLGTIVAIISTIFLSDIATQSGIGEILNFAKENIWTLYVSSFFLIILIAYKIKHEKNKKRKKLLEKYNGSLIGKPL